ncbi:hypothetical protein MC7420_7301 [Coleofasciculus chthonoplastes PCC 7420]|uniref:Uncharacterized protein n=1 Tax=Coleofasciculus chthonoplastes PCC 7420 TaxID=118168 RepID=B4VH46_9CYAN|nr:hypothetical protein MC7420_7301 [Coleofasciculus chthonoplastes PCC 7420]
MIQEICLDSISQVFKIRANQLGLSVSKGRYSFILLIMNVGLVF